MTRRIRTLCALSAPATFSSNPCSTRQQFQEARCLSPGQAAAYCRKQPCWAGHGPTRPVRIIRRQCRPRAATSSTVFDNLRAKPGACPNNRSRRREEALIFRNACRKFELRCFGYKIARFSDGFSVAERVNRGLEDRQIWFEKLFIVFPTADRPGVERLAD